MNLKKLCIGFVLATSLMLLLNVSVFGQDKKPRYLFQSNGKVRVSGFGGPLVGFSSVMDEFAVTTGGGGAALFNQKFFVGGYGEGLATEHFVRDLYVYNHTSLTNHYYDKMQVTFGHGGLWLGYIHDHHKILHWGASLKIGVGGLGLAYPGFDFDEQDMLMTDVVFVFTPQIEMEVNLFPWMKMNFGASYRLVSSVDKTYEFMQTNGEKITKKYFSANDFSSPTISIGFLFGGFSK